jgi:cyclophilin family peptidyl-prolyl cis-trans isomerase
MLKNQLILFTLIALILTGCENKKEGISNTSLNSTQELSSVDGLEVDDKEMSKVKARIKTIHGDIVFKFYPKQAPNTVVRIMNLIKKGFYNGVTFHRVVPGFVIQGGDPTGSGMGGSGSKLKAEFSKLKHVKGTVAMARSRSIDSADSQFIFVSTQPHTLMVSTLFSVRLLMVWMSFPKLYREIKC